MPSKETLSLAKQTQRIIASFQSDFMLDYKPTVVYKYQNLNNKIWSSVLFRLPMPPSINRWTRTFRGKAHKSPPAEMYMALVRGLAQVWDLQTSIDKLKIEIHLHGLPARSDIDGRTKQLLDALQGNVCHDDYQFRELIIKDMGTKPSKGSYVDVKVVVI